MSRRNVGLSVFTVLLCCTLPIWAQIAASDAIPPVKYSGTLIGSSGQPLRGIVGVSFYLYKEKEGGVPVWMETQNVRLDKNGHYSVMLGSATAYGLPAEVFEGTGARWLGVQPSGQIEQPRTLLFSLPYGGMPASASPQTAQSPLVVNPGPDGAQKLPPTVHGNGVVNFIPLWTDTKIIGESSITQSGSAIAVAGNVSTTGNVGVGTTTPATSLDVFSSTQGVHAPMAQFGSKGGNDANSIVTYTGSGIAEMWQSGCVNCFMPGVQIGDGGLRVSPGKNIFLGDSGTARLRLDSAGNASQPRTGGGMVKAMMFFSPFNGGRIVSCFNSTLSGAAATTPPCGFAFDITGVGDYLFVFGFQVDDRILSLTAGTTGASLSLSACNDIIGTCGHVANNQQVEVFSFISETDAFVDSKLYLVVY